MKHTVEILEIFLITHNVKSYIVERPDNYKFEAGQATEVAINKDGWRDEKRPFTFTNHPGDDYLQFIIKTYPDHQGVTNELQKLKRGDKLILHDVFGTIRYQGNGTFIAGGTGITPFIPIFRHLRTKSELEGNRLIFANKTTEDIILQKELEGLFGDNFINILSEEKTENYSHGLISTDFLQKNITDMNGWFYICGPPPMTKTTVEQLADLGIPEASFIVEGM